MSFTPPEGWKKETPIRFRHESGIIICLTEEYGQKGWYIVPNNDSRSVRWFIASAEGRDEAFKAFEASPKRFGRKGPRYQDGDLHTVKCLNCGEDTAFAPHEAARASRSWCEDCYDLLK